jgi:hypothetical protein
MQGHARSLLLPNSQGNNNISNTDWKFDPGGEISDKLRIWRLANCIGWLRRALRP